MTLVAAVEPNFTVAAEVKFVPVMATEVPPAVEPPVGLIEEIVGVVEVDDPTVRLALASIHAAPLGAVVPDGQFVPLPLSKPRRFDSNMSRL